MSESVEQAARRVLEMAREAGELPLALVMALADLRDALEAYEASLR